MSRGVFANGIELESKRGISSFDSSSIPV
eukprot:gene13153-biopygen3567